MRFKGFICLIFSVAALVAAASDEIQGSTAEVLEAIKSKEIGKVYAFNALISVPPASGESQFVVRDKTGSVVIRRDFDWPTEKFRTGDNVRIRCEIGSTASIPAAAFFRNISLVSRSTASGESRGNWLVTAKEDESAKITKLPHYLTPTNILLAICSAATLILVILAWNTLLRRHIDRRSRELASERLASFSTSLKVEERTRLSVELHDTISQMLTGIALELDAARDFAQSDTKEMNRHLDLAARTLSSCRNDLRNCMWDLRNQTLDDYTMDEAIRRTLAPHISGVSLSVRFAINRELLSDTTALAILRIIRELTHNAVRHGKATTIKIAGCIENSTLLFSVTDNGGGFDPAAAPGVEQGHFGLQGITERTEQLNGELKINSTRGKGTKAVVSIVLNHQKDLRTLT